MSATSVNHNPIHTPDLDPELLALLKTPMPSPIPAEVYAPYLTKFPFVTVSPTSPTSLPLNLRTISTTTIPPFKLFRAGTLALPHLTLADLATLNTQHKITTIFDMRSQSERIRSPSPEIPGIKTIWIPSATDSGHPMMTRVSIAEFEANEGEDGYIKEYGNMMIEYRAVYKGVFERIAEGFDDEDEKGGILFHCTAGKDRTGILAALILAFVSTPADQIAHDYALTRIGIEPFREGLLKALMHQLGKDGIQADVNDPGLEAFIGARGPTIVAVLKSMDEKWGNDREGLGETWPGVQGYLRSEKGLGLSEEVLASVKNNLGA